VTNIDPALVFGGFITLLGLFGLVYGVTKQSLTKAIFGFALVLVGTSIIHIILFGIQSFLLG